MEIGAAIEIGTIVKEFDDHPDSNFEKRFRGTGQKAGCICKYLRQA